VQIWYVLDVLPAHLNRDSFRDSFKGLVALEIILDLPFGFPINNIISLSGTFWESKYRGEFDLGLCTKSGLAKRMWLRSADFQLKNVFGRIFARRRKGEARQYQAVQQKSNSERKARGVRHTRLSKRSLHTRLLTRWELRTHSAEQAGAQNWKNRTLVGHPQYRKVNLWYMIFVIHRRLPREPIPKILVMRNQSSVLLVAAL